jgi:hypothetical protein
MTVVIGLDGKCLRLCTLFWDGNDWVTSLRYDYKLGFLNLWNKKNRKKLDKFYFLSKFLCIYE